MTESGSWRFCLALVCALPLSAPPLRGEEAPARNVGDSDAASGPDLSVKRLELRGLQDTLDASDEQKRKIDSEIATLRAERERLNQTLLDATAKLRATEESAAEVEQRLELAKGQRGGDFAIATRPSRARGRGAYGVAAHGTPPAARLVGPAGGYFGSDPRLDGDRRGAAGNAGGNGGAASRSHAIAQAARRHSRSAGRVNAPEGEPYRPTLRANANDRGAAGGAAGEADGSRRPGRARANAGGSGDKHQGF